MPGPKYALDDVKKLVNDWKAGRGSGWFSAVTASTEYVIHVFSCTEAEAEKIILDGILKLDESDFSRRALVWDNKMVADIYGLASYLGHNWYIKFLIEDDTLEEISFHPLEGDLKLEDGRNVEATLPVEKRFSRNKARN